MAKLKVDSVLKKEDSSYNGRNGERVECTNVLCSGSVDGSQQEFIIKIFGKGGGDRIKAGIECVGKVGVYNTTTFYTVKKADNPHLFTQSSGQYNKRSSSSSYSLEQTALRLAIQIVQMSDMADNENTPLDIADAVIDVAKQKIIPFIIKSQKPIEKKDDKSEKEIIVGIIAKAGLTDRVRAKGMMMSELLALYKETKSHDAFIQAIYSRTEEDITEEDDSDIPF